MSSILNDTKHILGLLAEDTAFDNDLMLLINGKLNILTQLNVGPKEGYEITGPMDEWTDFIGDIRLNSVKSYIFLTVKLAFDPPSTGFVLASMERQIEELVFRINVFADYG